MRRRPVRPLPLLITAALAIGAAACTTPAGTDGDLVNSWPRQAAASYTPPAVGDCLAGAVFSAFERPDPAAVSAVDCAQPHTVEVVAVAPLADAPAPPAWDSDATRAAYTACDRAASEYAGGDWHTGRLVPYLSVPNEGAWRGGVRTTVCGLAEAADDLFAPRPRTGSLKGGLREPRPLALTCVDLQGDDVSPEGFIRTVDAVEPVACTEPHDTEFVGTWSAPAGPVPTDAKALGDTVSKACFARVAAFMGLSELQLFQRGDVYTFWDGLTASQWRLGDRTAHCFLNVSVSTTLRASLQGLGTKPLPRS